MGVFSFLKDKGMSLFGGGDEDEAEKVQGMLNEELGGRVQDVNVEVSDGVVKLTGKCDSRATLEKAVLLAGNIEGVSQVDDSGLAPESAGPAEGGVAELNEAEESQFYVIQSGDSLSKIAKEFYGSGSKYPLIFEANREVIKDPDKIYPGQTIRIPKLA